jgi:hypothetical protein
MREFIQRFPDLWNEDIAQDNTSPHRSSHSGD